MTWCSRASTISAGAAFPACWQFRRHRRAKTSLEWHNCHANPVPCCETSAGLVLLDKSTVDTGEPIMSPAEARLKEVPSDMTEAEWNQRVNLAACYRLIAHYGWDDLVDTHISARVPGPDHHFLINPYGLMFDEITASSLVKVDREGKKVIDSPFPVNPAGFVIHSAVHEAREDIRCVLHTHTRAGVAVSAQKC